MLEQCLSFIRGILALFFRSLRIEARSFRMHLLWLLLMRGNIVQRRYTPPPIL